MKLSAATSIFPKPKEGVGIGLIISWDDDLKGLSIVLLWLMLTIGWVKLKPKKVLVGNVWMKCDEGETFVEGQPVFLKGKNDGANSIVVGALNKDKGKFIGYAAGKEVDNA